MKLNIFRILAILIIGEMFLLIVFENLPSILSSFLFYALCWFGALALLQPRVLLSKSSLYIYFWAFLYALFMFMGIYDIDYRFFLSEILYVFLAISIYTYFISVGDYKGLARVILFTLIFIVITNITSIIGLDKFPMAARDLGGILAIEGQFSLIELYRKMGIASYGFFTGLSFTTLVIVYQIKNNKGKIRFLFIILLALIFWGLIKAQITAPLLLGTIGIIIGFGVTKEFKYSIIIVFFILLIFVLIPKSYISDIIVASANLFGGTTLHNHLIDISNAIDEGIMMGDTHVSYRANRIPFLLEEFSKSPIIGGGESTGHVFWLDRLSMFGLIGIIPWILILISQIKLNLKILSNDYKFYYLVSMLLFVSLGFMKNMDGREMMIIVFFLIPGIYYLKYLKKTQAHHINNFQEGSSS